MRPNRGIAVAAGLALAALLWGCGEEGQKKAPPSAQSQSTAPSRGYFKVGAPYQVEGVWYYPGIDERYDETGIASWYGPDFHGKYTANGETYNMNDLTAAHPTLPLPSVVRVTNLDNGRSIVVRVNDRGPYVRGRIIDLSRRAAQLIGMVGNGTAKVRVQILPEESHQAVLLAQQGEIPTAERIAAAVPTTAVAAQPLAPAGQPPSAIPPAQPAPPPIMLASAQPETAPLPPVVTSTALAPPAPAPQGAPLPPVSPRPAVASPPPPPPLDPVQSALAQKSVTTMPVKPTSIFVQIGAFKGYDNANRLRGKLAGMGVAKVTPATVEGQPFYRVRLGPATSVDDADRMLGLVVGAGYHDARIVVE